MKFNVFAFSASDFAARRTIVRLARRNRTLQTILSLPDPGRLKTADRKSKNNVELRSISIIGILGYMVGILTDACTELYVFVFFCGCRSEYIYLSRLAAHTVGRGEILCKNKINFFEKVIDKRFAVWYNLHRRRDKAAKAPSRWEHSSAGRASALQAEGHRFEPYNFHQYGPVVQLVRTLACHARGRGFEPHPGRQFWYNTPPLICLCSSVGRAED